MKPKLPENFVNDTWNRLERAVRAVHESKPVPDSLEELYQACENLCHHKKADELYVKLRAVCDQYVRGELLKINEYAMRQRVGFDLRLIALLIAALLIPRY